MVWKIWEMLLYGTWIFNEEISTLLNLNVTLYWHQTHPRVWAGVSCTSHNHRQKKIWLQRIQWLQKVRAAADCSWHCRWSKISASIGWNFSTHMKSISYELKKKFLRYIPTCNFHGFFPKSCFLDRRKRFLKN